MTFKIRIGRVTRVPHAVERARRITQHPAIDVTPQLKAHVAVRRKTGDQGTFIERGDRIGLQLFQAHRHLEFTGAHLQPRGVTIIGVGVINLHRRTAEVRHEHEIKILIDRALKNRAGAAQKESIVAIDSTVLEKRAVVHLHQPLQTEHEIRVRRTRTEAAGTDRELRRSLGRRHRRVLVQFTLPRQNPDLLIQILVLLFDRVRRGLLVRLALLFKRLHFLAQLADMLLQGFNVRITVSIRAVCGE